MAVVSVAGANKMRGTQAASFINFSLRLSHSVTTAGIHCMDKMVKGKGGH